MASQSLLRSQPAKTANVVTVVGVSSCGMPTAAQVFLEGAVKDLERLKANAELIGGELALLAYLLDMALVEAQERQGDSG